MRHKDPALMKKISEYIRDFYIRNDRTPSTTEIAKEAGICRASAQNYLVAMDKEKMLSYKDGAIRIPVMDLQEAKAESPRLIRLAGSFTSSREPQ